MVLQFERVVESLGGRREEEEEGGGGGGGEEGGGGGGEEGGGGREGEREGGGREGRKGKGECVVRTLKHWKETAQLSSQTHVVHTSPPLPHLQEVL